MSDPKPAEKPKEEPAPPAAPAPAPAAAAAVKPEAVAADSSDYVGKRIVKKFNKKNYFGEITEKWTEEKDGLPRWHTKYDDGDEEDFNQKEIEGRIKTYEKAKRFDYKIFPRKPSEPKKKRKEVVPAPARTNKYPKRGTAKKD